MAHARTQILTKIKTVLLAAGTSASERIYEARVHPVAPSALPALILGHGPEDVDPDEISDLDSQQVRVFSVVIDALDEDTTNVVTQLNTLCAEVEVAIAADNTLAGYCDHIIIANTEPDLTGEQEKPRGRMRMTFTCQYSVAADDPETILTLP